MSEFVNVMSGDGTQKLRTEERGGFYTSESSVKTKEQTTSKQ